MGFLPAFKMATVDPSAFFSVELRVWRILKVEDFPEAKKPAYKLTLDFGPEIGTKRSSAQITHKYRPEDLVGRLIVAVTNFPPKQIGPFVSEALVTGVDGEGWVILLRPDEEVPPWSRVY